MTLRMGTEKLNRITAKELDEIRRKDEARGEDGQTAGSPELLPCGAWADEYWQDENGYTCAACAAGDTFIKGKQSGMWHFVKVG